MRRGGALAGALALLGTGTSCVLDLSTGSAGDTPSELVGKSFQSPVNIEPSSATPQVGADNEAFGAFSGALVGGDFLISASHRNSAFDSVGTSSFPVYFRRYAESTGWGLVGGPDFRLALSATDTMFYNPIVGEGPSGNLLVTSYIGTGAVESTEYDGTSWTAYTKAAVNADRNYLMTEFWDDFPRSTFVTDGVGRGYLSSTDEATDNSVVMFWRAATGFSATTRTLTGQADLRYSNILYDGSGNVCQLREVDNAGNNDIIAYCADATVAVGVDPTFSISGTISGYDVKGHDEATDGSGQIVSVFYGESLSGAWGVYSWFGNAGTWDVGVTRLDGSGLAAVTYESAGVAATGAEFPGGTRPAVSYLGSGRYLAVWVALDMTNKVSQPYYSVYTAGSGWSTPVEADDERSYTIRSHYVSPVSFEGLADNALVAMRVVVSEGANDYDDGSRWWVGRFHCEIGWFETTVLGFGCSPGANDLLPFCSHTPVGAVLPAGDSILVFPDQDSSGQFRLRSVAFSE